MTIKNFNQQSHNTVNKKCIVLSFFYIDERRRYTKKVHALKAWVDPSIVKRGRRENFMGWVGVEGISGCGS